MAESEGDYSLNYVGIVGEGLNSKTGLKFHQLIEISQFGVIALWRKSK